MTFLWSVKFGSSSAISNEVVALQYLESKNNLIVVLSNKAKAMPLKVATLNAADGTTVGVYSDSSSEGFVTVGPRGVLCTIENKNPYVTLAM